MSTRSEVLLWAQRICAKKGRPAHDLLELTSTATAEAAQEAFHRIARIAHPDLHRNALTPDELELVTRAYALAAGAYQALRTQKPGKINSVPAPVVPSGSAPAKTAAQQMSSKALVYYRKAELALRQGDLKSALLQLKMAIAADPGSTFLRAALAEVESELRGGS